MATIYPTKIQMITDGKNTWRIKFEYFDEFGGAIRVEVRRKRHNPKWYQNRYELTGFAYTYKHNDEEKFSDLVQAAYNKIIKNYYAGKETSKELDDFFLGSESF